MHRKLRRLLLWLVAAMTLTGMVLFVCLKTASTPDPLLAKLAKTEKTVVYYYGDPETLDGESHREAVGVIEDALATKRQPPVVAGKSDTKIVMIGKGGLEIQGWINNEGITLSGNAYKVDGSHIIQLADTQYRKRTYTHSDGSPRAEGIHSNGEKHGLWRFFDEDGNVTEEGEYHYGCRIGTWRYTDSQGNAAREEHGVSPRE